MQRPTSNGRLPSPPYGDATTVKINLNKASLAELQQLPGVGPILARRIIHFRRHVHPFSSPEEIMLVDGFNAAKYAQLADQVFVDGDAGSVEPPASLESESPVPPPPGQAESPPSPPEPLSEPTSTPQPVSPTEAAFADEAPPLIVSEEASLAREISPAPAPQPVSATVAAPEPAGVSETVPGSAAPPGEPRPMGLPLVDWAAGSSPAPELEATSARGPAIPPEAALVGAAPLAGPPPTWPEEAGQAAPRPTGPALAPKTAAVHEALPHPQAPEPVTAGHPLVAPLAPRAVRDWTGLLGMSLLGAIIGAALTLLILAGLNRGTLILNEQSEIVGLTRDVGQVGARVNQLEMTSAGLRTRLEALEGLTTRVSEAETALAEMQTALQNVEAETAALGQRAEALEGDVATIRRSAERFDAFLAGLRELLNAATETPATQAGPSPTSQPGPSATPTPGR